MNAYIIFQDKNGNVLGSIPAPEGVVVEYPLVITVNGLDGLRPLGVSGIRTEQPRVRKLTVKDFRPEKKKPAGRFDPVRWLEENAKRLRRHDGRNWHPAWMN